MLLQGFFGRENKQRAVRVFNPFAHSYCISCLLLSRCYYVHEQEKRRAYDERIRDVETASFSLLVFVATGGMGPTATSVYRKLILMLADKWTISYSCYLF